MQDYRPGADTDHGYGHTRVVPLPASPAPLYLEQLEALKPELTSGDPGARTRRRHRVSGEGRESKILRLTDAAGTLRQT